VKTPLALNLIAPAYLPHGASLRPRGMDNLGLPSPSAITTLQSGCRVVIADDSSRDNYCRAYDKKVAS
jgi:hypothetical protein